MSNSWFNIRFGCKHFHWEKGQWPKITHNTYWENGNWKNGAGWFRVYTFFGISF